MSGLPLSPPSATAPSGLLCLNPPVDRGQVWIRLALAAVCPGVPGWSGVTGAWGTRAPRPGTWGEGVSPGRPAGVCAKPRGPQARLERGLEHLLCAGAKGSRWLAGSHALLCSPHSGSPSQCLPCPLCWSQTSAFAARSVARLLQPDQARSSGERSPKLSCHLLATGGGDAGRSSACGPRLACLPSPVGNC